MCGIVTFINTAQKIDTRDVVKMYIQQQSRGREGFGFSYVTEKGSIVTKRFANEAAAFHELARVKSHCILLHHRRPTSTANIFYQNQPITRVTAKGTYVLAHNGIIFNDKELRNAEYKDLTFTTQERLSEEELGKRNLTTLPLKFNDSEVLLHSMVDHVEEGKDILAHGAIAFVMLVGDESGKAKSIMYGRNNNPLFHVRRKDGTEIISSENYTMEEKDKVEAQAIFTIDLLKKGLPMTKVSTHIPAYVAPVTKPFLGRKHYGRNAWENEDDYVYPAANVVIHSPGPRARGAAYTPPAARDPKLVDRIEAQKDYVDFCKYADELVAHLQAVADPKLWNIFDRNRELREIDDMIRELNEQSQGAYKRITGRVEDLIKALNTERVRFLKDHPGTPIDIVEPPLIASTANAETETETEYKRDDAEGELPPGFLAKGLHSIFKGRRMREIERMEAQDTASENNTLRQIEKRIDEHEEAMSDVAKD